MKWGIIFDLDYSLTSFVDDGLETNMFTVVVIFRNNRNE